MIDPNDLSVLVVEDDDFQRQMLVKMLRSLGVNSISDASNGQQAIDIIRLEKEKPVDIVLSDLNMPEMDGLEFLRHLGEEAHNVALVIVSALGNKLLAAAASMAKALDIKILNVIEKPILLEQLRESLSRYERTSKARHVPISIPKFALEEIQHGIRAKQFQPYFQPKVELMTGQLVGAEALCRWVHPEHGVISPTAFIPQLEQSGNIDDLTFDMIEQSAAACRSIHDQGHALSMAVNLSAVSLDDTSLADKVVQSVRDAGFHPKHMVLEISETAAMSDVAHSSENLARLCMNGFSLSIDDYGTGYSNMQQLTRIAFSELKIDQSFVRDFSDNHSLRIVVESSLDMARRLRIKSVAEGVETQQDWDALKSVGCDIAQGYFIAKPMELGEFNEFVSTYSP